MLFERLSSPMLPEIGLFGGGGLVVPVVRFSLDGLLLDADVAAAPSIGLSSFTFTGRLIVADRVSTRSPPTERDR